MKYFADGVLSAQAFERARIAAQAILDESLQLYRKDAWDTAYGSSGTIGAVSDVLSRAGWSDTTIDRDGLEWMKRCLIRTAQRYRWRYQRS